MDDKFDFLYVEDDPTSRIVMDIILKHNFPSAHLMIYEDSTDFPKKTACLVCQAGHHLS